MKQLKLSLIGLDCANCANKIETKINSLKHIKEANVNFTMGTLTVEYYEEMDSDKAKAEITEIVHEFEPDVVVEDYNKNNKCSGKSCNCSDHNEEDEHEHGDLDKKDLITLIIGAAIYVIAILLKDNKLFELALFLISYLIVGYEVIISAVKNIFKGRAFDENFLMTVATVGAFAIGEYPEAVAVMLFYQIGELLQGYAVNKSRKSISALMDIRADYANLLDGDKERRVSPEKVKIGDIIVIKPGERVPLDGILLDGKTSFDTSALTGESVVRTGKINEEVLSGFINLSGVIKVKVTKSFGQSTVSRILELVENANSKKAETEKFITKFAKVYTPIVVLLAVIVAVVPPLVIADATFNTWIYRALVFLVVSCPCALVVSVPLGIVSGIGAASKNGVIIKGGNYLEILKNVNTIVFDKTGTLTKGVFKVTTVNAKNISEEELIKIAAYGESFSSHPIAKSIVAAYGKSIDKSLISKYNEVSGSGISVNINNDKVLLGNIKLMKAYNISFDEPKETGTVVHAAINNEYKGYIIISDEIKDNSKEAIKELKNIGIKNMVMLTGDNHVTAEAIAKELGITKVYSELLPGNKVEKIEELINNSNEKEKVAFVGDGINDAPVLARADVGIAMGGMGSDAAIEAADIVLMKDDLVSLLKAIKISRKTNNILWQNIIFALAIKVFVLILGAIGVASIWEGVFADVGVTLLAVLNSIRALKQ